MLRRVFLALGLLLGAALPLSAQDVAPAPVEMDSLARVRVVQTTVAPRTLTGRLVFADSQVLTLERRGERILLPLPAVQSLERSVARLSEGEGAWWGAKRGFLGGAAVGAVLVGLGAIGDAQGDCGDCFVTASAAAAFLGVSLTALTTTIGAVWGAVSPPERWERVVPPVRLRGSPAGS